MCGITGCYSPAADRNAMGRIVQRMADTLSHRGPDDSGVWIDSGGSLALGHRRLSILDLSPLGHQPMASHCHRFVISYNGEVYNHLSLRSELERAGFEFRGTSDTETILAAIAHWGISAAVKRFVGMFAFALWDKAEKKLYLVRDRLGIKPLYYGWSGDDFLFGSELKAIKAHPGFGAAIDRNALSLLFRHNYIPTPYCIYKDFYKQRPGTILTIEPEHKDINEERYWNLCELWLDGVHSPFEGSQEDAVDALEELLGNAIEDRMLSDVPVGAFLSGGIDSSTVVALMQKRASGPVKTFCLGFEENDFDEAGYAVQVARHLGTEHVEERLFPQDLLKSVPDFPRFWDEPFSDTSQLAMIRVSQLARNDVTVCLSGDGGDELFMGYPRYFQTQQWGMIQNIPATVRKAFKGLGKVASELIPVSHPKGLRSMWRLSLAGADDFADYYRYLVSHNKYPASIVLGGNEPCNEALSPVEGLVPQELMPLWDLQGYVYDGILTKVDRASMATGLEARVPILDHRVVEFAARVPIEWKIGDGRGKHLLRKVLYRHVPTNLVDRPKMGFGVPLVEWLKGSLRPWVEDLFQDSLLQRQGLLDPRKVRGVWHAFLKGMPGGEYAVWDMLMFQAWLLHNEG